jgi:pyruvate, water dikinase
MTTSNKPIDRLVYELQERTKELNCLYRIEERLNNDAVSFEQKLTDVVNAIPPGWQYPSVCAASLTYLDQNYQTPNYADVDWRLVEQIGRASCRERV